MSLISIPYVETSADTVLHIAAAIVLISTIAAGLFGFWKLHEIPIQKAHKTDHHQIGLITVLTWIGFIWHWVWVLAIIIAFVDFEKAIIRLRDLWNSPAQVNQSEDV